MARDEECGRWFEFKDGNIRSGAGLHPAPDCKLVFKNATIGAGLLMPPINWLQQINAQKDFVLTVDGPEDLTNWFAQTVMMSQSAGLKFGTRMPDGSMRYCNMTNGGPVFVYVKDGKIVRMTPIDLAEDDGASWTIEARGVKLTPPRKTTLAPHGQNAKSIVYSPDRLLYPMKRVDFDPNGERNPQNRGKSGYVRISWEEAIKIVTDEIKRQKREHGPGAIAVSHGSHHTWGNVGYYLSALFRFANAIGMTRVHHNPDSWEGWYWGAVHHWGHTLRVGQSETYGTVEDCLQNCDMIVSWAADPESTSGSYGAQEGTVRRQWLKDPKLGIKVVHVDPYYNATAQFLPGKWFAPRPTTSVAMAMAIAYVWIKEGLYDKEYVETHTVGFDKWKAYLLGDEDGIPKTPEWQEKETGVPAKDVRALAREWGRKRVYLAPGGWGNGHGGACRNQTGIQWARVMVCLSAMQGLGKPGCNMGNLQWGCPLDFNFYFPGYSEGGMSGDLENTAMPVELYQRMPQLPTMNSNAPDDSAHLDAGGDHRGQGGRLSLGRQVDRAPVRQVHVSGGRPFAGAHALQVRRLDPRDHEQHQPLGEDVSVGESRVRRQPVDLVRGRGEVRRRHPAGLHQFRAHRHLANGPASAATATTASSSSTTASSCSRRRRSSRWASRSPTTGSSTRSASGSASPTTSPKAATRSTGSSASISPPTCRR